MRINRPPFAVTLHAWGRAAEEWWGCVTWQQRVTTGAGDDDVPFAAWVPAASLSRPSWTATEELPRLRLPADPRQWPAPRGWPAWFAGVWRDGEPACPPGVRTVVGAGWRRKPR
ncbi:hypothetical protein [Jatrophihabitans endophyticus]|uniref:hypothetical protein n=1 Tax=Jatrophihabitans endophyticus TaxID=1206085 RepID=UPI0011610C4F|nr:hypothetical protein [Jatrophihabitans endophyticus]